MTDPRHFERHADVYETARPPYPAALWARLSDLGCLRSGDRAIDLGAGTGQATGPLLEAGLHVTAVEPGAGLAAQLRISHPQARIVVTTAERAELEHASFELAVAATSAHWMDLDIVLPKVRDALVSDGRFAVWRNVFGDPDVRTPFRDRVAMIVSGRSASVRPGPDPLDLDGWVRLLTAGEWFRVESVESFRWSIDITAEQIGALFTTFSDWTDIEVQQAVGVVEELGGLVTEHYLTPLIVLSR